jgi:hypothetical protein
MHILQGDISSGTKSFETAKDLAEKHELGRLVAKTTEQLKSFENEFEKWDSLIQSNASLKERIEKSNLKEYITKMIALREIDL